MQNIDLILFDLDGTLIDSRRDIVNSVNLALESRGYHPVPVEKVASCIGRGIYNLFRDLVGEDVSLPVLEKLVAAYREMYSKLMTQSTALFPGVREMLEHYDSKPKAVITNKSQVSADEVIDAMDLRKYFRGIYGADAFATQKPDPGPVREICRIFAVPVERAVLVGDTTVDMAAGKAAGAKTAAALYGYGDELAIREMRPDFEIRGAAELLGLF